MEDDKNLEAPFVDVEYIYSPQYAEHYVTGGYGGHPAGSDTVSAFIYVEHGARPVSITQQLVRGDDGLYELPQQNPPFKIVRSIQAHLMMSPENAMVVGEWLRNMGIQAIARRASFAEELEEQK